MNSRQRTFLAMKHECGDRIPVDFWASEATVRKLEQALGISYAEFLDRYDVDLRYIEGPRYVGPPIEKGGDIWGVKRSAVRAGAGGGGEVYSEVTLAPLADAETVGDVERYPHWPSPDWYDYGVIEAQCDAVLKGGRVAVFMGDRLNRVAQLKPAMYLRGTEQIFLDLALREDVARAIFRKIREFYLAYTSRILAAARGKIDIVLTGDDFGAQNACLLSPDMWREFLQPGFREYVDLIHSRGATVMHHTCGSVVDIVPDLIESGLDVLQSVQPEARGMSLPELKRRFGDRLCFQGGISIQKTLPFGTPDDIRREVKTIADAVGRTGGYIFCTAHNIQADTSVENILALLDAYREYGAR